MAFAMKQRCPIGQSRRHKPESEDSTVNLTRHQYDKMVKRLLAALNCPRALTVWLLYESGEHVQLLDLTVKPTDYCNPIAFRDAYCATELLSKATFLETGNDLKATALKKFEQMEAQNQETNLRIRSLHRSDRVTYGIKDRMLATALTSLSFKIASVLGEFRPLEWVNGCDWGPGATLSVSRREASRYSKYRDDLDTTKSCLDLVAPFFVNAFPLWSALHGLHSRVDDKELSGFSVVQGNRVVTVPKNAKTDRVICIEPGINLFLQKGLGRMLRNRLKRVGIDLNDQNRNQQLARAAIPLKLATVDFSSASDTISSELVREILPRTWWLVLDSVRSRSSLEGRRWEKFSTMGNGFTFELESLIFWAAAVHACECVGCSTQNVSVFGDDVILPLEAYELFSDVVHLLGFSINTKKTCVDNVFRESCGAHFYEQYDTKPLYLRDIPKDISGLFKLANGIRGLGHRRNDGDGCDLRLRDVWKHVVDWIPAKFSNFVGPPILGDSVLHGNFDEATPARARFGFEGWIINVQASSPRLSRPRCGDAWLLSKLGVPGSDTVSFETTQAALRQPFTFPGWEVREVIGVQGMIQRTGVQRVRPRTVLVSQWYDMGPWV